MREKTIRKKAMNMNAVCTGMINIKSIEDEKHPMYQKALELYEISFPPHEQREKESQKEILQDKEYCFGLVYDQEVFVGLVLYWETEKFIYVEHLCIAPDMRNKQYGQKVLAFLEHRKKTVILEIDPPIDDTSKRRKAFYERCGFVENSFSHIHPPYHKGNKGHKLIIMTCPKSISPSLYDKFEQYLKTRIMLNAFKEGDK